MDPVLSERLDRLESLIVTQGIQTKEILNIKELTLYTGIKTSYIYKLTSAGELPCYKPSGKVLFFRRSEIDQWLLRNRNKTNQELEEAAQNFMLKSHRSKSRK